MLGSSGVRKIEAATIPTFSSVHKKAELSFAQRFIGKYKKNEKIGISEYLTLPSDYLKTNFGISENSEIGNLELTNMLDSAQGVFRLADSNKLAGLSVIGNNNRSWDVATAVASSSNIENSEHFGNNSEYTEEFGKGPQLTIATPSFILTNIGKSQLKIQPKYKGSYVSAMRFNKVLSINSNIGATHSASKVDQIGLEDSTKNGLNNFATFERRNTPSNSLNLLQKTEESTFEKVSQKNIVEGVSSQTRSTPKNEIDRKSLSAVTQKMKLNMFDIKKHIYSIFGGGIDNYSAYSVNLVGIKGIRTLNIKETTKRLQTEVPLTSLKEEKITIMKPTLTEKVVNISNNGALGKYSLQGVSAVSDLHPLQNTNLLGFETNSNTEAGMGFSTERGAENYYTISDDYKSIGGGWESNGVTLGLGVEDVHLGVVGDIWENGIKENLTPTWGPINKDSVSRVGNVYIENSNKTFGQNTLGVEATIVSVSNLVGDYQENNLVNDFSLSEFRGV